MKLVRFGEPGQERPGLIDSEGRLRDLAGHLDAVDAAALAGLRDVDSSSLPVVDGHVRFGVPVNGIGKIVCIGLNYADHAAEAGLERPVEPIVFFKPTTSLNGPDDPIRMLRDSRHCDWEVELAVVIGKHCYEVPEAAALDHVAGYCIANDVSERKFQAKGSGQWVLGKSGDTWCPLGPWLVTADEIADPQNLRLTLDVNGKRMQDGTTADMIFPVAHLVHFVSRFMSLEPGDVMLTGTPAGVALGHQPPVYLQPGDRLHLEIDGLGAQNSEVIGPL